MIAEGDEELLDLTGEKLPDSSGESNRIHHSFTEAEWIMTILKQSDLLEKKNITED